MVFRNNTVVVGELTFDQLADKLHTLKTELSLVTRKLHFNRTFFVAQQALHFKHRLTRQYHFLFRHFNIKRGR